MRERGYHDRSAANLVDGAFPAMPVAACGLRCGRRRHPRRRDRRGDGGQDAAIGSGVSGFPEGQPELRELQAVPGPKRLQERRRRDQPEWLVQHLGESLRALPARLAASARRLGARYRPLLWRPSCRAQR